MEPGDDRVPVPDRQGPIPGPDAAGPQGLLRDERQPRTKVSQKILTSSFFSARFSVSVCSGKLYIIEVSEVTHNQINFGVLDHVNHDMTFQRPRPDYPSMDLDQWCLWNFILT